jgi:hypothetical protein
LLPESSDALLVAGQALATWVDVFQLPLPSALMAGVTSDLDFLGDKDAAMLHHRLLSGRYERVELIIPRFGEVTPNTAKILVYGEDQEAVEAEIDYLGALCGYGIEDEDRLKRRAIEIEFPSVPAAVKIRVMHPFDCLKSRIHNLATLTAKQNYRGVAQALLASDVQRAYFRHVFDTPGADIRALIFPMAEAVIDLACQVDGVRVYHEFGVDVIACIEPSWFPEVFRQRRWPKALEQVQRRRFGRKGKKRIAPRRHIEVPGQ